MKSCQLNLCLVLLLLYVAYRVEALPTTVIVSESEAAAAAESVPNSSNESPLVVITEDVIPDVDNTTQKVIRVNPLDVPSIKDDPSSPDSSLYKIETLQPVQRHYVNSNRMRQSRLNRGDTDSPIVRGFPEQKFLKPKLSPKKKKKHLHFLYNQEDLAGNVVGRTMRVHVAPGAYPVYYAVSKSNGRFGKFPIKNFSNKKDFMKYLVKSKLEPIALEKRFES